MNSDDSDGEYPLRLAPEALLQIASMRLSGAVLSTFLAVLSQLDETGKGRVTQPELQKILGTGPGRVWQNLQALAAAGILIAPGVKPGYGRKAPYSIPQEVAIAPNVGRPRTSRWSAKRRTGFSTVGALADLEMSVREIRSNADRMAHSD